MPLSASDGENGLLDLGHRVMSDLLKLDMRHVRHLVGNHDGIDNRRAIDGKSVTNRSLQLTRFSRRESVTAAGAGQCREVRIWKFDGFAEWHDADAFGLQRDQSKRRIIV